MIQLTDKVTLYRKDEYKLEFDSKVCFLDFKNNIVRTKRLLKRFMRHHKNISTIVIDNYNDEVVDVFRAIYIEDRREKLEFIYDTICDMLDDKWAKFSPCDFCNNKCIASRNKFMDKELDGCCYSFKRKRFGKVKKEKCMYLDENKKCKTKNISCKLFTCDYLKKNGIFDTNYEDYLLLELFFNKKERLVIKYNFFKNREEVIDKLLEKNYMPYLLYLLKFDFLVKD